MGFGKSFELRQWVSDIFSCVGPLRKNNLKIFKIIGNGQRWGAYLRSMLLLLHWRVRQVLKI